MGQWSQGGMIMVGDMFNNGLKYRVDALCNDLANLLRGSVQLFAPPPVNQNAGFGAPMQSGANWWPADLGHPSSSGGQNDMRYAYFPGPRRLAVLQNGHVTVYDTGDHSIGGFSQQQGGGQSATFSSQFGQFSLSQLPVVSGDSFAPAQQTPQWAPEPAPQWQSGPGARTPVANAGASVAADAGCTAFWHLRRRPPGPTRAGRRIAPQGRALGCRVQREEGGTAQSDLARPA